MTWLQPWDVAAFRWINHSLAQPWLDRLMPWLSGNPLFMPALMLLGVVLIWKGGARGRLCATMFLLVVGALNNAVVDVLKDLFDRPRPFVDLPDVRLLVGRGRRTSLPSGHAANWMAAAVVAFVYYRRSLWLVLPLGLLVGFSRIYNGVHYPSDVLAGLAVGAAVGAGGIWLLDGLWRWLGARWFPLWWRRLPSLSRPVVFADPLAFRPGLAPIRDPALARERQWLHAGYVVIAALLCARLAYVQSETIELSKDEAYQWLWSKHLAWSYFSKPPLVAYFQWVGTQLWGDTALGIRFFAPVITALASLLVLRFLAREVNARAAFCLILVVTATPLLAVGSILFTIDAPSVLFWTAAMLAGWKAMRREGRTRDWLWTGLWLGLGFLSKYTALLQWVSLAMFWVLWPPAWRHLRRPGPYLALAINALCALPVLIWNAQNDWITVTHLEARAGLDEAWRPTLRFFLEFTGAQFALLNPVFCGGAIWAAAAAWRRRRQDALLMYAFAMAVPLFLGYWLYSFRARVQPNWIAPAVLPLLLLMVVYADARWRTGARRVRAWFHAGLAFGLPLVFLLHDSNLMPKVVGLTLPPRADPCRRVRGWREAAVVLDELRQELRREGKPVFIIGEHYGLTSLFSFYLPEAKAAVAADPLVYCVSSDRPRNQFHLWPGYAARKGQNALYVMEVNEAESPPPRIVQEFASVQDLGVREIRYRGRVFRKLQFIACRDLR